MSKREVPDCTCLQCGTEYAHRNLKKSVGAISWLKNFCSTYCYLESLIPRKKKA